MMKKYCGDFAAVEEMTHSVRGETVKKNHKKLEQGKGAQVTEQKGIPSHPPIVCSLQHWTAERI